MCLGLRYTKIRLRRRKCLNGCGVIWTGIGRHHRLKRSASRCQYYLLDRGHITGLLGVGICLLAQDDGERQG